MTSINHTVRVSALYYVYRQAPRYNTCQKECKDSAALSAARLAHFSAPLSKIRLEVYQPMRVQGRLRKAQVAAR